MKLWSKSRGLVIGAIATQLLCQALPSHAATLSGSFSEELGGKVLSGSFTGTDGDNNGQLNAWDLTSFNATWGDFSWDLSGLGGFRKYEDTGLIDWIYAQQYQSSSQQVQTLSYTPLQVGVFEFSISDVSGIDRMAYNWRWENGIAPSVDVVADDPNPIAEVPDLSDPTTSVPEPSLLLGLGAVAAWSISRRDRP